jgi:hypothetical protein
MLRRCLVVVGLLAATASPAAAIDPSMHFYTSFRVSCAYLAGELMCVNPHNQAVNASLSYTSTENGIGIRYWGAQGFQLSPGRVLRFGNKHQFRCVVRGSTLSCHVGRHHGFHITASTDGAW